MPRWVSGLHYASHTKSATGALCHARAMTPAAISKKVPPAEVMSELKCCGVSKRDGNRIRDCLTIGNECRIF